MGLVYPEQSIPEKDKTDGWKSKHLDYAEALLKNYDGDKQRMLRLVDGYNGVKLPGSLMWLESNYGKQNKSRYVAYRLGRTKIDLLNGEWLKRPLQATVTTVNADAMSDKMGMVDLMIGAMIAKDELKQIKEKTGVDVMEGVPIPEDMNDPMWEQMSFKDKCEDVMQIILNNQITELDVKKKLASQFLKCEITNRCFVKIERNEEGDIELHDIDPWNAIFEPIEGDDYLEKSPIMGCLQVLPVHEILRKYGTRLTKDQRRILETAQANPGSYIGNNGLSKGYMTESNGELLCSVIHIEWQSFTASYWKVAPATQSQLMLDPSEPTRKFPMDAKKYESNIEYHNKNVAEGLYKIETTYHETKYEATRIGGLIDVDMREVMFQKRGVDNPSQIMNSSYVGYIHGRLNGTSVSLQQIIENFDNIFDINMYQILKEFARMKGKVLTFDRAALGQGQKTTEVLYNALNDQFLEYDSSAAGNTTGRQLDPAIMFKEFDLGLSESFQYLIAMKQDIINFINQITGINESRAGVTAASSTATNAQSDISNSRTITEALFYGFAGFQKRVLKTIVNDSATAWAFYKIDKGQHVLGVDKLRFLQVTKDIGYRDYDVQIEDGTRYMEISQKIEMMMTASLNAKEIRPMDALNVLLAETVAQKRAFLETSWKEMKRIMQESEAQQQQAQAAMQQQQLQTQIQIAQEDREDRQAQGVAEIQLKGEIDKDLLKTKIEGELFKENLKAGHDAINNTQPLQ